MRGGGYEWRGCEGRERGGGFVWVGGVRVAGLGKRVSESGRSGYQFPLTLALSPIT